MIQTQTPGGFGQHLIVDGYGCDYERLCDVERIRKFLHELPGKIGMKRILPAWAFPYNDSEPEDWGVTGIVIIATSHISIHTFPERNFLYFDAFSCKKFNEKAVLPALKEEFKVDRVISQTIDRGIEFGLQRTAHVPLRAFCGAGGG